MTEPLPIKDWTEPLIIKGNKYFVIGTGTDDDGQTIDTLQSERTGEIKTFKRSVILKNLKKKD